MAAVSRDEIPDKYKWNVAALFPNDDAWEDEYERLQEALEELPEFEGTLAKSASNLADYFERRDALLQQVELLGMYASLRSDEDTRVGHYLDMDTRGEKLSSSCSESISWEGPEIAEIDRATLEQFIEQEPRLQTYRHYLDNKVRWRPHILSTEEEELIAMAERVLGSSAAIAGQLRNADMGSDFPSIIDEAGIEVKLTPARFEKYRTSKDPRVRRDAFAAVLTTYAGKSNTLAAALAGAVESHIFLSRARGFDSSLDRALFAGNVPTEVYRNLLATVKENIGPVHRYVSLRKRALGLDELHYYDLYPSLAENPRGDVPWEDAVSMVLDAVSYLGDDFVAELKSGLAAGWVDVFENEGKRPGAYSHGTKGSMPYILMNYGRNINGAFTLAHEAGHSMHTTYTSRKQDYVNCNYSIFVAEVASTALEALLQHKISSESEGQDKDAQIYMLDRFIRDMMGTMIRQTMFAEFELAMHETAESGQSITAESLDAIYADLLKKYYGNDLVIDEHTVHEWARIPHFFYNFYVYQYATSYAASFAIAERIVEGVPGAEDRFLELLADGGSNYPIEQLKAAGVDMTTPEPVEAAMRAFDQAVTRLESLIDAS